MSTYSIGAMNQLGGALEQAGFSPSDVTKLKQFKNLSAIKDLLNEQAFLTYQELSVNTEHLPTFPEEYKVIEHLKNGKLSFSKDKLDVLFFPKQNNGKEEMQGTEVLKLLRPEQKLNVAMADFLLKNPSIIPDSWRNFSVCFWGTLLKSPVDNLAVLFIFWSGRDWHWGTRSINAKFDHQHPAAILLNS